MIQHTLALALFSYTALTGLTGLTSTQSTIMRQLDSHVHGEAELMIALDGHGVLLAELSSPAWNLYGFEGHARTAEQVEISELTARHLNSQEILGFTPAANCLLDEFTLIGDPLGDDVTHHHGLSHDEDGHDHDHDDHEEGHHHEAHDHGDHDHEDHDHEEHDHEEHDDHDHGEHDHDHDESVHSDTVASWTFSCANPERLNAINLVTLFGDFPRLETVDTQFVSGEGAAAAVLTPNSQRLSLNR